ncbi:MAG: O-antigen ligase family protein, partial [Vicinamibacterales bacterium]
MHATTTLNRRWVPTERLATVSFVALLTFVAALQISIAAASLTLAATLTAWLAWTLATTRRFEAPAIFWPLLAYGGWTLVSAVFSANPAASLEDCKQLVLLLIVPAVYTLARGSRSRAVLDVIVTVGAITAVVGIFQYGILHYDNLGRRPQGTLTHYMTYSGVLMLVIGAAAARLIFERQHRLWTALVMPALLVALALTFTRSAWVGAFVALAVLALLKDRRLLFLAPVLVAAAVAVAPDRLTSRAFSMFDLNDPTSRDRVAMLRTGAHMIADHPITGVGPDQVKAFYVQYRDPLAVQPINFHLHNVPVQIAAERGLPALGLWIWFVVTAGLQCWRLFQRDDARSLAAAALAALVAMLAAGLFEYNFGDSEFLMLFLVLLTLPFAAVRGDAAETVP